MIKKSLIILLPLLALTLVVASCGGDEEITAPPVVGLKALTAATPPVVDGTVDAVWANASAFTIQAGANSIYQNAFGVVDVTMKAITQGGNIYILAQWNDPSATESISKKRWTYTGGAWAASSQDEDRFFIMFDAGDNGTEKANCASMCHMPSAGMMATSGGGHVDVWHWKAARTNPAGFADDKWWTGAARGSDAKITSAYTDNVQIVAGLSKPVFMHSTGTAYTGDFLFEVDKVVTDFNLNWTGKSIPYYVVDPAATGSRWDVAAKGVYSNGMWTVEMSRALNTGNADDVVLGTGAVQVTVAITDNSGGNHSGTEPFLLNF